MAASLAKVIDSMHPVAWFVATIDASWFRNRKRPTAGVCGLWLGMLKYLDKVVSGG